MKSNDRSSNSPKRSSISPARGSISVKKDGTSFLFDEKNRFTQLQSSKNKNTTQSPGTNTSKNQNKDPIPEREDTQSYEFVLKFLLDQKHDESEGVMQECAL